MQTVPKCQALTHWSSSGNPHIPLSCSTQPRHLCKEWLAEVLLRLCNGHAATVKGCEVGLSSDQTHSSNSAELQACGVWSSHACSLRWHPSHAHAWLTSMHRAASHLPSSHATHEPAFDTTQPPSLGFRVWYQLACHCHPPAMTPGCPECRCSPIASCKLDLTLNTPWSAAGQQAGGASSSSAH